MWAPVPVVPEVVLVVVGPSFAFVIHLRLSPVGVVDLPTTIPVVVGSWLGWSLTVNLDGLLLDEGK